MKTVAYANEDELGFVARRNRRYSVPHCVSCFEIVCHVKYWAGIERSVAAAVAAVAVAVAVTVAVAAVDVGGR